MPQHKENKNKFKAKVFKALSDPVRISILETLRGGEKCVCEIVPLFNLIQPVVSRHLKILKDCGIITGRKDKNRRLYSVTDPRIFRVIDSLDAEFVDSLKENVLEQVI
ncbi:MAG TPA: metalloregulator ArsR/SmtB family transcription factor [Candidatus Bathyarchaeia archaeon]